MKRLIVLLGLLFLLVLVSNAFALTVSVPYAQGSPGDLDIAVPISISDFTANDIRNMELTLKYDAGRLAVVDVESGVLTSFWRKVYKQDNGAGEVKICLINLVSLPVQSGTVAVVRFSVKTSAAYGESDLTLTKGIFKVSSADLIINGKFKVVTSRLDGPSMEPIPPKEVKIGQLLSFYIVASGDGLIYSAAGVPSGAVFDPVVHKFSWVPKTGQQGQYSVTFTVTDALGRKASQVADIKVALPSDPNDFIFKLEAEKGVLSHPMQIKNDDDASGGKCIYSKEDHEGSASYTFNVPTTGDYRIWCRTKSSCEKYTKVFNVYLDGNKKYLKNKHEDSWEWLILKTEPHGSAYHYKVKLSAGAHTMVFKVREKKTYLDKIIITNNLGLEP